jgi:exonuclease III
VATMNLYNTNKLWKERFQEIADMILKHDIDIVGVQEVRTVLAENNKNQLEYLMEHLPKNYNFIYEPVMNIADPNQNGEIAEEGLAIISKHNIGKVRKLHQRTQVKNWNNRLCLNALVILDDSSTVDFYVTHQAIDPVDQCTKMKQILDFMNNQEKHQVILGDFNTYYDFPYPMDILTSVRGPYFRDNMFKNKNCEQDCQRTKFQQCVAAIGSMTNESPFTDIWEHLYPHDPGHTFTNYRDQDMSRPDRILFRKQHDMVVESAQVTGDKPLPADASVYVSDHRMLIATVIINS